MNVKELIDLVGLDKKGEHRSYYFNGVHEDPSGGYYFSPSVPIIVKDKIVGKIHEVEVMRDVVTLRLNTDDTEAIVEANKIEVIIEAMRFGPVWKSETKI